MKVLLVHDYGTPTGGAERQMLALRDGLRARGHEVRLFASDASLVPSPSSADDHCFGTTTRLQVLTQVVNPSAVVQLRRVLHRFRPDVVHVRMMLWQLSPAILPLLRGRAALYQAATYKAICPTGTRLLPDGSACTLRAGTACLSRGCLTPQSWVPAMLQRALWARGRSVFGAIVALSDGMRAQLEAHGLGPVRVIHNGVAVRPPRVHTPHDTGGVVPTIAYAGRLVREKGVHVLVDAFAAVRRGLEARLLILGDGPARTALEAQVRALGLTDAVAFTGYLDRERMEATLEQATLQVVPSLWDEPFGNVTTEAMMRGTPVIASAVAGQRDIVRDGVDGFLVPPGDAETLAVRMRTLVLDAALADRLGAAGRARALADFSEASCVARFEELYRELIAARVAHASGSGRDAATVSAAGWAT